MICCDAKTGDVRLAPGVRPAGTELMRRVGLASAYRGLPILVKSGDRTPWEAHRLRMGWLRRLPGFNLAARCDHTYGIHSWAACGKTPRSNHARGLAVDMGFITSSGYRSFMLVPRALETARAVGLWAPLWSPWNLNIEAWHMEKAG